MKKEIESLKSIKDLIRTNNEEIKKLEAKKADLEKRADSTGKEFELCESEKKSVLDRYTKGEASETECKAIKVKYENLIAEEKEVQEFLQAVDSAIERLKGKERNLLSQLAEAEKALFRGIFAEIRNKVLQDIGPDGLTRALAAYYGYGGILQPKEFLLDFFEPVFGKYGPELEKLHGIGQQLLIEYTVEKE